MTGPSPVQSMIGTILQLKRFQLDEEAAALAEKQYGLGRAATTEQVTSGLRALASSVPDPKVFLPHVQELAGRTGLPEDLLNTIFSQSAPSTAVTRDAAVARGAGAAGTSLDASAASTQIAGAQPGELAQDDLQKLLFTGARSHFESLPPEQQQGFNRGVLTRVAKGQTMGEALNDELFAALPKEQQSLAVEIGKGLAPSAGDVIQGRLGTARLKLEENNQAAEAAYRQLQIDAAMAEAKNKLSGSQQSQALEVLKAIQNQQQFLSKNSGTFTEEGQIQQTAALNALYSQLKAIDPHIGGIFELIDPKKPLTATSPFGAFMQKVRQ